MGRRGRPCGGRNATPLKGSKVERVIQILRAGEHISIQTTADEVGCSPSLVVEAIKRWSRRKAK